MYIHLYYSSCLFFFLFIVSLSFLYLQVLEYERFTPPCVSLSFAPQNELLGLTARFSLCISFWYTFNFYHSTFSFVYHYLLLIHIFYLILLLNHLSFLLFSFYFNFLFFSDTSQPSFLHSHPYRVHPSLCRCPLVPAPPPASFLYTIEKLLPPVFAELVGPECQRQTTARTTPATYIKIAVFLFSPFFSLLRFSAFRNNIQWFFSLFIAVSVCLI